MEKIIQFDLSGKFAHFKFPFTSPNFLKKSFLIPPRTTILGILGSIIGLNGFQQYGESNEPEYYEKLKHIKIGIGMNCFPSKKLIIYNSLNSFARNIALNPNVMIKEEILLNPSYKIILLLNFNNEYDKKLYDFIKQEKATYHLYLGKNEFFANITNFKEFDENQFTQKNTNECESINTIFPLEYINFDEEYQNSIIIDSFSKDIDFSEKKLKTKLCEVAFILDSKSQKENISFNEKLNLYEIENKNYYLF